MLRSYHVETVMNVVGYSHGRHDDQKRRVADFRKIVKGTNFLTPRPAGFYRLKAAPSVIVEVSLGEFNGSDLIGCTVVNCATGENLHDENKCLHSTDELPDYFAGLEKKFAPVFARFARSNFGGGWILPDGREAFEICEGYFGEPAISLAPIGGELGYIIEPQDVPDTVEGLRAAGCEVTL